MESSGGEDSAKATKRKRGNRFVDQRAGRGGEDK